MTAGLAPLLAEVREWTSRTQQPLMPWICEAIRDRLEWEQLRPRCDRCGSVDMQYGEGDFATGVTAPDGGCEYRWEEFQECMRCGNRQQNL